SFLEAAHRVGPASRNVAGLPRAPRALRLRTATLVRITFLCPHVRIAGGVRAILTYADRLAGRGHRVTVLVPAPGRLRALSRRLRGVRPDWLPSFRARVEWVTRWSPEWLPPADVIVATAWQSAPIVAAAPAPAGRKFYLVQHYESLYH